MPLCSYAISSASASLCCAGRIRGVPRWESCSSFILRLGHCVRVKKSFGSSFSTHVMDSFAVSSGSANEYEPRNYILAMFLGLAIMSTSQRNFSSLLCPSSQPACMRQGSSFHLMAFNVISHFFLWSGQMSTGLGVVSMQTLFMSSYHTLWFGPVSGYKPKRDSRSQVRSSTSGYKSRIQTLILHNSP